MLRVLKYWVKDDDSLSEKMSFPRLVLTCLYFNIRSFMTEYTSSCINYFVFGVVVIFLFLKFKCSFCNHLAENFMRTKSKYLKGMLNLTLFLLVFRHNLQRFNFTTWREILQVYFFLGYSCLYPVDGLQEKRLRFCIFESIIWCLKEK